MRHAVIMAGVGDKEPDFGVVQPGATRAMVEAELGPPYHTDQQGDQHTAWYEYEMGNAPNDDRALGHFALDVYSFLLWEFIATPMELMRGDDFKMSVTYGPDDRVVSIHHSERHSVEETDSKTGNGASRQPSTSGDSP